MPWLVFTFPCVVFAFLRYEYLFLLIICCFSPRLALIHYFLCMEFIMLIKRDIQRLAKLGMITRAELCPVAGKKAFLLYSYNSNRFFVELNILTLLY